MIESVFSTVDSVLSFAPAWVRLCIWGIPTGVLAMWVYGILSPQDKLKAVQEELSAARKEMNAYSGTDPKVVVRLTKRSLGLAFQQVGIVFLPTMIAAAPVFLILYGIDLIYAGQTIIAGVPEWLGSWETVFLSAMSVGAIFIKVALKIR